MITYDGFYYDPDIKLYIEKSDGRAATPAWMATNKSGLITPSLGNIAVKESIDIEFIKKAV